VKEKRRLPRLNAAVAVRWEKAAPKKRWGLRTDPEATKNISAGGICLVVHEDVEVGDRLDLDIELPGARVIHAAGRVIWTAPVQEGADKERKGRNVGIEFLEITKEDREEIQRFVWTGG